MALGCALIATAEEVGPSIGGKMVRGRIGMTAPPKSPGCCDVTPVWPYELDWRGLARSSEMHINCNQDTERNAARVRSRSKKQQTGVHQQQSICMCSLRYLTVFPRP